MSTAMLINGHTEPGKRDELYELYVDHVVPHVAQDDAITAIVWSADRDNADAYTLFEVFADGAEGPSVMQSDWFKSYMQLAAPLAAQPPEVRMLSPRWTKGI
jgi:quinol monooxygenase YgiN